MDTQTSSTPFSPLQFLAAVGAGGIGVMGFALMQNTLPHPKGLINISHLSLPETSILPQFLFWGLLFTMVTFTLLHFILSFRFFKRYLSWRKTPAFKQMLNNPLANSQLMAPYLSLGMTFNVVIASVRFFIPSLYNNFQSMMLPALIAWAVVWGFVINRSTLLLKVGFQRNFDLTQTNFGWLLHPFSLAMVSVVGTGIAALSENAVYAHIAAFLSLTSLLMAIFLMFVKLNSLFSTHFAAPKLPSQEFMPSFLIVLPILTLITISLFRLSHYGHHHLGIHTEMLMPVSILLGFAFQTWYFIFGLRLLNHYFKNHFIGQSYHVSQWGLICPFVGYGVTFSFFFKVTGLPQSFLWINFIMIAISIALYLKIMWKTRSVQKTLQVFRPQWRLAD